MLHIDYAAVIVLFYHYLALFYWILINKLNRTLLIYLLSVWQKIKHRISNTIEICKKYNIGYLKYFKCTSSIWIVKILIKTMPSVSVKIFVLFRQLANSNIFAFSAMIVIVKLKLEIQEFVLLQLIQKNMRTVQKTHAF